AWGGALATAGDVVFYGTLEGYLKAVDSKTGKELYKFKTPSGIIGNVMTYEHKGKQYVGVLSGVGGWAGIGLAAGLTDPNAGLGAVGGYAALSSYTNLGGQLTVFVILNDNDMSIAPPVGAMSAYLARLASGGTYRSLRETAKQLGKLLPKAIYQRAAAAEEYARSLIVGGGTMFEEMGFHYVGPVDGHNLDH
ncbi:1-deoxy-D-xylulose-5-phosphate synthase N-terminal domain-containing protein, partial [Methylorubrum sp. POS3]|uniref:1-deoxy-D-xylulose-5-phosphate synthase N-terminal domain-containing protein n=1 Tax=Methylorubrum sp. POS3 TaxID=2998492 RepID=UPI00372A4166